MPLRFAPLLSALLLACGAPSNIADAGAADAGMTLRPLLHAHNDYEHPRPLLDALDQGFESVEVDVYFQNGELEVSHFGDEVKGTLRGLYLDPLAMRVAERGGSVHGDGKAFYLWIDLKEGGADLTAALSDQLSSYAYLTRFTDGEEQTGAVTVILTGNDGAKETLAAQPAPRPFIRDANVFVPGDPPADSRWAHYSLNFLSNVNWDGAGEMPEIERRRFQKLIDDIHAKGRKVRFWAAPETDAWWKVASEAGVDFLGTDELQRLRAFADGL